MLASMHAHSKSGYQLDEIHVGLRIMAERAKKINASLDVVSTPSHGSSIILVLPTRSHPMLTEA